MFQAPLPDIWLVTGIPGAGKSAIAHSLAQRLERAAHIDGDGLAEWIVAGRVLPGDEPEDESERQVELCIRNQCLLARSYAEAGFTPVIDYVIPTGHHLDAYRSYLLGGRLRLAVVAPPVDIALERAAPRAEEQVAERWRQFDALMREELRDVGLWIDSAELSAEQAVDAILEGRDRALLQPVAGLR